MVSEELARCLAKICGDGNINKKYLRYNNTCQILLDEFEQDMLALFPEVHFTKGIGNSGTSFVQVQKGFIVNYFLSHLDSFRSYDLVLPESVKDSSVHIQNQFIRSFYGDEGCVALRFAEKTREWKRNITLSSNSYEILSEIKELLKFQGIMSNKIYRNAPKSERDNSYLLSITGKNNFILFRELIGFSHPRKNVLLDLLIESYASPKRNIGNFNRIKSLLLMN